MFPLRYYKAWDILIIFYPHTCTFSTKSRGFETLRAFHVRPGRGASATFYRGFSGKFSRKINKGEVYNYKIWVT